MTDRQQQWNASYQRRENFVFAPAEQLVRFISRHVRKRVGLHEFADILKLNRPTRLLDLGCGIGRHIIFAHEMGLEPYGIDLSPVAVHIARDWAQQKGIPHPENAIREGSITALPFENKFFDVIVSHGVLDSVPFPIAQAAAKECARVLNPVGLFYCDLISPNDSHHGREFAGEETVSTQHEQDTIQSYFNFTKIQQLFNPTFEIKEAILVKNENLLSPTSNARTHLVLKSCAQ
jgi:SAM-dependent methyltransferase